LNPGGKRIETILLDYKGIESPGRPGLTILSILLALLLYTGNCYLNGDASRIFGG